MALEIVSGGQTGVDRAALDVALEMGLECSGWCPKGRRAEDGPIDTRYPLTETESAEYAVRTKRNVRDTEATLVLNRGSLAGGTAATVRFAEELVRPYLIVQLDQNPSPQDAANWLLTLDLIRLNVAGPRESKAPGIHAESVKFLSRVVCLRG